MQIIPVEIPVAELVRRMDENAPHARTPGLHLSDIYKALMVEMSPERFDPSKPMDMIRVEAGLAYERILELGLLYRHPGLVRPGEIVHEGIIGSPDGIDIDADPWRLVEYKCTWMSIRYGITDKRFWHWFVQIKGYLYMLNEAHGLDLLSCLLIVYFVNGDYSYKEPLGGPQLVGYHIEFDRRDLVENWAMLMNFARNRRMIR